MGTTASDSCTLSYEVKCWCHWHLRFKWKGMPVLTGISSKLFLEHNWWDDNNNWAFIRYSRTAVLLVVIIGCHHGWCYLPPSRPPRLRRIDQFYCLYCFNSLTSPGRHSNHPPLPASSCRWLHSRLSLQCVIDGTGKYNTWLKIRGSAKNRHWNILQGTAYCFTRSKHILNNLLFSLRGKSEARL